MKTLSSSLGWGTSLIAATVTAATVVAVAPAQAAQLNGSVGLSGNLDITDRDDGFSWAFSENVVNDQFGDFAGLSFSAGSSLPRIANLDFECSSSGFCATDPVASFIDFGEQTIDGITDTLTFNLDAAQYMNVAFGNTGTTVAWPQITGNFVFNGSTLAEGTLAGSYSRSASTYQMTLTTQEVPEPLTIMGTGLALGFGGLFQRQASKRKNQKSA